MNILELVRSGLEAKMTAEMSINSFGRLGQVDTNWHRLFWIVEILIDINHHTVPMMTDRAIPESNDKPGDSELLDEVVPLSHQPHVGDFFPAPPHTNPFVALPK
ncbi:MAG: hypothetical protein Q9210_003200 [Variospora velana]